MKSCFSFGFLLLGLVACGRSAATPHRAPAKEDEQLTARAAFDLRCDGQLTVVEIDARTRGVRGCDQQATYVKTCQATSWTNRGCTWVMNAGGARASGPN